MSTPKEFQQSLNVQVNAAWTYLKFVDLKSCFDSKVNEFPPHILRQANLKRFVTPKKTRKKKLAMEKPKNFLEKSFTFLSEKIAILKKEIFAR